MPTTDPIEAGHWLRLSLVTGAGPASLRTLLREFGSPEAIWEFEVKNFPAVVTMDSHGNSLHKEVFAASQAELAKYL